jgi:hypothetical protein
MLAGYIGASARFDDAIVGFAGDYADQTERDWQALVHSRHSGKPPTAKAHKPAKPARRPVKKAKR